MIYLKSFNRYLYFFICIFNNISSENHKLLTFLGGGIPEYFVNSSDNINDGKNPFSKEELNIVYLVLENEKIKQTINKKNITFSPPQSFNYIKGLMLSHSFDEVFDNIYCGVTIMTCNIFQKISLKDEIDETNKNLLYLKRNIPFAIGGYLQYQNDENEDYSFFVKISALACLERIGLHTFVDHSVNEKIVLSETILYSDYQGGALGMAQIGFKFGCLEISGCIGINWIGTTSLKINSNELKVNGFTWFCSINIGFLFK